MEWDQKLFLRIYRFWQRLRQQPVDQAVLQRAASLASQKERLEWIAKILTGTAVQISRAEQVGGLGGARFFLPEECSAFSTLEKNHQFYLFRLCFLSVVLEKKAKEVVKETTKESAKVEESEVAQASVEGAVQSEEAAMSAALAVVQTMWRRWPGLRVWSSQLIEEAELLAKQGDPSALRLLFSREVELGHFLPTSIHHNWRNDLPKDGEEEGEEEAPPTQKQAPARERVDIVQVDQKKIEEYTLLHQFEKVETLDEFSGPWRDMDGADDLEAHEEALQEVDLRHMVRTDTPTHSVYQTEIANEIGGAIPESADFSTDLPFLFYPEWDAKKQDYLKDHCKVFLERAEQKDAKAVEAILQANRRSLMDLRRRLMRFRNELEQLRAQTDGEHPDLDALVEAYAERQAGRSPDERLYLSRRRMRNDISVSILMDCSLSTDAYCEGRRVMDVEKQAILLFGQILAEQRAAFRVDAFWSRTRNACHSIEVKGFRDPWSDGAARLAALQPVGYTRIGPALRHATATLQKHTARRRWILLLSDGKPNDYDRYEGRHGIQDVRYAIREANEKGIRVYALALDKEAKHTLPQMFGHNNYKILAHPDELPEAMLFFYTRLLRA